LMSRQVTADISPIGPCHSRLNKLMKCLGFETKSAIQVPKKNNSVGMLNMFYFHPKPWGNLPNQLMTNMCKTNGLVQLNHQVGTHFCGFMLMPTHSGTTSLNQVIGRWVRFQVCFPTLFPYQCEYSTRWRGNSPKRWLKERESSPKKGPFFHPGSIWNYF